MTEIDYSKLWEVVSTRKLTLEEFEAECIALSGGTVEQLREYHDITSCNCGELDCPGWKTTYLLKNKRARR